MKAFTLSAWENTQGNQKYLSYLTVFKKVHRL